MKLIVETSAYRLKEDTIVSLNAVDKKGYAGQWVVTHPDGKMEILEHEDVKARAATEEDLAAILETEPVKEEVKEEGGTGETGKVVDLNQGAAGNAAGTGSETAPVDPKTTEQTGPAE